MAGNISIVHKVTGSSRTFVGEEAAGISAVETAFAQIRAGQSSHTLVGGAFVAERADIILLVEGIGAHSTGGWLPLWSRHRGDGGGMIMGSVGAFLVLESRTHAEGRGAHIYAAIDAIEGDRGGRDAGRLESRLARLSGMADETVPLVFSGSSGLHDLAAREKAVIEARFSHAAIRGYGGITGHSVEAHFPLGISLAALSIDAGAVVPVFDPEGEQPMGQAAKSAVVTSVGYVRGEGMALLSANNERLSGSY